MSGDALFVYGSLRSDVGGPMLATLEAGARRLGAARVRGRLFVVDWYPGAVLGGDAWIEGELWAIEDASLLATLDAYEDCDDEFVRTRAIVHASDGSTREAWVYAYARPTDALTVVASGDWLAR